MSRRTTKTATNTHTVTHLSTNCTPEGHPIVKIPLISRLVPYIYAVADTVKVRDFFFSSTYTQCFCIYRECFFCLRKDTYQTVGRLHSPKKHCVEGATEKKLKRERHVYTHGARRGRRSRAKRLPHTQ